MRKLARVADEPVDSKVNSLYLAIVRGCVQDWKLHYSHRLEHPLHVALQTQEDDQIF